MDQIAYGPHPEQRGELTLPAGSHDAPLRVAVLWHGGAYAPEIDLAQMRPLAADLAARGWAAWNVTYRRLDCGGGWPQTFDDAIAAVDHLATLRDGGAPLDLDRVTAIGLSAGAPLALYAARRPGDIRLVHLVNQAGLSLLTDVAHAAGEESSITRLLGGGPDALPDVYAQADPAANLPLGVPSLHVHGADDDIVPSAVSSSFAELARAAGDDAKFLQVPGDHFTHLDPASEAWRATVAWMQTPV